MKKYLSLIGMTGALLVLSGCAVTPYNPGYSSTYIESGNVGYYNNYSVRDRYYGSYDPYYNNYGYGLSPSIILRYDNYNRNNWNRPANRPNWNNGNNRPPR